MNQPDHRIRLLRIAEDDLIEIVTYVAADRPPAAEALASKIEKNLGLLAKNPQLGRVPREEELARMEYRYLVVDDYLIFYVIEGRTIFVHRSLHGARLLEALLVTFTLFRAPACSWTLFWAELTSGLRPSTPAGQLRTR